MQFATLKKKQLTENSFEILEFLLKVKKKKLIDEQFCCKDVSTDEDPAAVCECQMGKIFSDTGVEY